jgi:hypothetical protein
VRIVIALGGNALLERGEKPDAAIQREHVRRAAQALAPLAAEHHPNLCGSSSRRRSGPWSTATCSSCAAAEAGRR